MKIKNNLKKVLLGSLIPLGVTAPIVLPLVSCNNSTTDKIAIKGHATYDKQYTDVQQGKLSTIVLIVDEGYVITGITSVYVGDKQIQKSFYELDSNFDLLTIKGIAMTSDKVQVEVETVNVGKREVKSIQSIEYTGNGKVGTYLNPYNLVVKALCTDESVKKLTFNTEYKVFLGETDITSTMAKYPGYKFTSAGTYYFTIKAGKDWSKPKELIIDITE